MIPAYSLLQLKSKDGLKNHALSGTIFENWCISEIKKNQTNQGVNDSLFYFRDHLGNEIDLIVERENGPQAIEIKTYKKQDRKLLAGLKNWNKNQPSSSGLLLYQGADGETDNPLLNYLAWENIDQL